LSEYSKVHPVKYNGHDTIIALPFRDAAIDLVSCGFIVEPVTVGKPNNEAARFAASPFRTGC
jgi:hypothetical protein